MKRVWQVALMAKRPVKRRVKKDIEVENAEAAMFAAGKDLGRGIKPESISYAYTYDNAGNPAFYIYLKLQPTKTVAGLKPIGYSKISLKFLDYFLEHGVKAWPYVYFV